ncbi:hypothetical protein P3S67_020330 [Capsicum chacoense]
MEYEEEQVKVDKNFPLFSRKTKPITTPKPLPKEKRQRQRQRQEVEKETNSNPTPTHITFSDLGLAEWTIKTCKELGLAQTGSGKTAVFALPILHCLAEDPYGVSCLVVTPTRELAFQLAEQFRALDSCLNLRCAVVVGGIDMINQTKSLMQRPHVVIATPGRNKVLIEQNPDLPWHHGTKAQRHNGTMTPWRHGAKSPRHHGIKALWNHGTKAPWHQGTMTPWHHGTVAAWHQASKASWHQGTNAPWQN